MMLVKVGGSLIYDAKPLMRALKTKDVLIVPGGGPFADLVRRIYSEFHISERAAHVMAVSGMDQYGFFLSDISGIKTTSDVHHSSLPAILLPSELVQESGLPEDWSVTSDAIACYSAKKIGLKGFLKLTNIEGIYLEGVLKREIRAGKLLNTTTCLDKSLPRYLEKWNMFCQVVNGKNIDDIIKALQGEPIGTIVQGGIEFGKTNL